MLRCPQGHTATSSATAAPASPPLPQQPRHTPALLLPPRPRRRHPLQSFDEKDWLYHMTWKRYVPEPAVISIVVISLAPIWMWSVAVSAALGLYATYAEVRWWQLRCMVVQQCLASIFCHDAPIPYPTPIPIPTHTPHTHHLTSPNPVILLLPAARGRAQRFAAPFPGRSLPAHQLRSQFADALQNYK